MYLPCASLNVSKITKSRHAKSVFIFHVSINSPLSQTYTNLGSYAIC